MRRNFLLGIVAIGLTYLYVLALVYGIGLVAALPVPALWSGMFSTRHGAAAAWILSSHFIVVLLLSAPFAWMIARACGRSSVVVSVSVALLILALFEIPLILASINGGGIFPWWVWLADIVQFAGSLPILVLLFRRLRADKSPA